MAACRARRRHLDVDVSVDVLEVSSFFCPNFLLEKEKMCEERRRDDDGEKVRATRAFFLATAAACVLWTEFPRLEFFGIESALRRIADSAMGGFSISNVHKI